MLGRAYDTLYGQMVKDQYFDIAYDTYCHNYYNEKIVLTFLFLILI